MKNQKGITLIALVITIIVLLILAGVSIAMLTSNDGIPKQAITAVDETRVAEQQEKAMLAINELTSEFYEKKYVTDTTEFASKGLGNYVAEGLAARTAKDKDLDGVVTINTTATAVEIYTVDEVKVEQDDKTVVPKVKKATYTISSGALSDWTYADRPTTGA